MHFIKRKHFLRFAIQFLRVRRKSELGEISSNTFSEYYFECSPAFIPSIYLEWVTVTFRRRWRRQTSDETCEAFSII